VLLGFVVGLGVCWIGMWGADILTPTPKRTTVVVFGDSITQQGFSVEFGGWVALLADKWPRQADFLNRGYSGHTTRHALELMRQGVIGSPNAVIVFFGANDACLPSVEHHVPLEEYRSNLKTIAKTLQLNSKVVLITPPPPYLPDLVKRNIERGKIITADRNVEYTEKYQRVVLALGKELNLPVVDLFSALVNDPKVHLRDGLHLSAKGNRELSQLLIGILENLDIGLTTSP